YFVEGLSDWSSLALSTPACGSATLTTQMIALSASIWRQTYGDVAAQFALAGTPISAAANTLTGAKGLLQAYTSLGLSRALDTNDGLRAMLFGDQGLYDGIRVQQLYQGWNIDPSADRFTEDLNPLIKVSADSIRPIDALATLLSNVM